MAKSKFFSLWGQKAEEQESEEDKKAREAREAEEQKKKDEEVAASDEGDEEEEDEEEDDEATKTAAAAVPVKVRASIVRAAHARIHAIVDGGGRDRVQASLQLALGTNLSPKAALAIVRATAGAAPAAELAGGRLGLSGAMGARRQTPLGPAAGGATSDVDKAASSIAAFAAGPTADRA